MKRQLILLWVVFLSFSMCVDAAELKNEVARQEGNRYPLVIMLGIMVIPAVRLILSARKCQMD